MISKRRILECRPNDGIIIIDFNIDFLTPVWNTFFVTSNAVLLEVCRHGLFRHRLWKTKRILPNNKLKLSYKKFSASKFIDLYDLNSSKIIFNGAQTINSCLKTAR